MKGIDTNKNSMYRAYKIFQRDDDLPAFIEEIKAFFAGIPYQLAAKVEDAQDTGKAGYVETRRTASLQRAEGSFHYYHGEYLYGGGL